MPKLKTHRGAAKRFKRVGGKKSRRVKHKQSHARHILTKKSPKRKRQLRGSKMMCPADARLVGALLQGNG